MFQGMVDGGDDIVEATKYIDAWRYINIDLYSREWLMEEII